MIGDLHCHTRLSDGSASIDDLIYYAKRAGLDFVAVTDHDTMDGVTRASLLGKRYGVTVVPGVELSARDTARGRKAHVLCYLPDKPDRLQTLFIHMLESRATAAKRMIRAVTRYYPVTEEHIQRFAAGSKTVFKVHIMQALMDLGYDSQPYGPLFQKLFGPEGLCLREPDYPDVLQVLETVHAAGGVAVLAHPPEYGSMELMEELAAQGLLHGVEAYHPRVGQEDRARIEQVADRYGLLKTGGSDFHGAYAARPNPLATFVTPQEEINAMYTLKQGARR